MNKGLMNKKSNIMENVIKFDTLTVVGSTKEEALESAPFAMQGEATRSYKKWEASQTGAITDKMKDEFFLTFLKKNTKCAPGSGFFITLEPAVKDTRKRPYELNDVKNTKGKRKYAKTFVIYDEATDNVLWSGVGTKSQAMQAAKQLYIDGFVGSIVCKYSRQVIEGEPIAFTGNYAPAKATKPGKYLVFGVKA